MVSMLFLDCLIFVKLKQIIDNDPLTDQSL